MRRIITLSNKEEVLQDTILIHAKKSKQMDLTYIFCKESELKMQKKEISQFIQRYSLIC